MKLTNCKYYVIIKHTDYTNNAVHFLFYLVAPWKLKLTGLILFEKNVLVVVNLLQVLHGHLCIIDTNKNLESILSDWKGSPPNFVNSA